MLCIILLRPLPHCFGLKVLFRMTKMFCYMLYFLTRNLIPGFRLLSGVDNTNITTATILLASRDSTAKKWNHFDH